MLERTDPVNWSTLKHILVSPKHYRYMLDHPREDTEALLLGRVTHCMTYEPDQLSKRYLPEPRFNRTMKDATALERGYDGGKESAEVFAARAALLKVEVVPRDLFELASSMTKALLADEHAGPMIQGGYAEQLVTWTDARTGIECRGRIDHINGCLSDLKTTRSIEPRAFAASAVRLGYHGQLAFYADGLAANGVMLSELPAIIAVENAPPHDVAVYQFELADIAAGRALYRRALDTLARCRRLDQWPGVAGGERVRIALPEWVMPEMELTIGGVAIE